MEHYTESLNKDISDQTFKPFVWSSNFFNHP